MKHSDLTAFRTQPDGSVREVHVATGQLVVGQEERVSYSRGGEAYDVYRHTNHFRKRIARIYHTNAAGNRRWQIATPKYVEIGRAGTLKAAVQIAYSWSLKYDP